MRPLKSLRVKVAFLDIDGVLVKMEFVLPSNGTPKAAPECVRGSETGRSGDQAQMIPSLLM